jgi:hypothetical protein
MQYQVLMQHAVRHVLMVIKHVYMTMTMTLHNASLIVDIHHSLRLTRLVIVSVGTNVLLESYHSH